MSVWLNIMTRAATPLRSAPLDRAEITQDVNEAEYGEVFFSSVGAW